MAISVTTAFKDALKGAVDRSQLKVEIYLGSWVDVTAYVEEMSGALEEISQLSGGASANTLNLTLINDDGRFSPKNTSGPYYGNLTPNKPIRVSAVYSSESVRMFTGYVSNWIPSAKARSCQVTAEDAARILRRKDITEETVFNSTAPTTGYYLTRVIERAAYLSGLRWDAVTTKTADWTSLDQNGDGSNEITATYNGAATRATYTLSGSLVMTLDLVDLALPCTPLKGKCLAVLDQLAKVVDGVIYFDAQGQLVFRSRMYRNDSTLSSSETFTVSSLEDVTAQVNFEDTKWSQLCNRAVVKSTPWAFKTDTSGAVVEEEIPFKGDLFAKYYFTAGERYPDYVADANAADLWCEIPNGIKLFKTGTYPAASNMVLTSVDNSDPTKKSNGIAFQAGYPVFEQTRVKVAFVNNGSTAQRIENLSLKAKLMRPIQRCQSIQKNTDSITLYDQRDKEVTNDYIPNSGACKNLAAWLVEDGRQPKDYYTLPVMYGCPWLELGDKITVSETITNTLPTATEAIIRRITWRWTLAAFVFTIEACSPAATFTAGAIPATVTNVETLNQNNQGQQASQLPPQTIDGTQQLVGLNNVPAFANITARCKRLTPFSPAASMSYGMLFDGSDLFVSDRYPNGYVYKINTMTGAQIGAKQVPLIGGQPKSLTLGGGLLFVSEFANNKLYSIPSDTFESSSYTLKADLGSIVPHQLMVAGGKLYATVVNIASSVTYLYQWNTVSSTRQDLPDATYVLTNNLDYPDQITYDGKNLWIPLYNAGKIAQFDTQTSSVSTTAINLNGGEAPSGVVFDGQSVFVGLSDGKILRYFEAPAGSGTWNRDPSYVQLATGSPYLMFDGTYIWANQPSAVTQIATTKAVIAKYPTDGNGAQMAFDGTALWAAGFNGNVYRIPRIVSGRQF